MQARVIHLGLVLTLVLFFLYIFSDFFKLFLADKKIDPNFVIGFLTATALLLSLIQSSKDKRYTYNLKLVESIEDKGLKVIGKLLNIKQKSAVLLANLKLYKKALSDNLIHRDGNDTLSTKDLNMDMESISSYIDSYFPEQGLRWNSVMDDLTLIGTHNANISVNYDGNLELIRKQVKFPNFALDNIDEYILEAEEANQRIEKSALEIRDGVVEKINDSKKKLKEGFDFSF